jgi:hypothetical protein
MNDTHLPLTDECSEWDLARRAALSQIEELAKGNGDRLTPADKMLAIGRILRAVGVWAERAGLPAPKEEDGVSSQGTLKQRTSEICKREFREFARAVWAATRDVRTRRAALCQISEVSRLHYDRLSPSEKMLGVGRVLRTIAEASTEAGAYE